jgi:hypothetical protein
MPFDGVERREQRPRQPSAQVAIILSGWHPVEGQKSLRPRRLFLSKLHITIRRFKKDVMTRHAQRQIAPIGPWISRRDLLQHRFSQQLLQAGVLALQLLQALRVRHGHAAILCLQAQRRRRVAPLSTCIRGRQTCCLFPQYPNVLLLTEPASLHLRPLFGGQTLLIPGGAQVIDVLSAMHRIELLC